MRAGDGDREFVAFVAGEELVAPTRVLFHQGPFFAGERSAAGQDTIGHMDLADVVEHRRQAQRARILLVVAKLAGQCIGEGADAAAVETGGVIVGLGGGGRLPIGGCA